MCKLFGFPPIHDCILFRQTRHVTTWNVFCFFFVLCLVGGKEMGLYA